MCTGSCSTPRQRLAGRTPRSPKVPLEPSKNKVFKLRRQDPGKRSLPGRPTKAPRGTCRDAPRAPARQQGPGKRSLPGRLNKVHRGPVSDTLVDALERGRRVAAYRGKRLAAVVILSGPEACRSPGFEVPWFVFPASSSCRGLVALPKRVARRGKFIGASWLAFPASSSCRGLVSLA